MILKELLEASKNFKFEKTSCSQCGEEFGPGDHGFSHCENHKHLRPVKPEGTVWKFDKNRRPVKEGMLEEKETWTAYLKLLGCDARKFKSKDEYAYERYRDYYRSSPDEASFEQNHLEDLERDIGKIQLKEDVKNLPKHVINKQTIVIDGRKISQDKVRKIANKHFFGTETGRIEDGDPKSMEHGIFLGANMIKYYDVKSIAPGIIVASLKELTPQETRPLARKYMENEK